MKVFKTYTKYSWVSDEEQKIVLVILKRSFKAYIRYYGKFFKTA